MPMTWQERAFIFWLAFCIVFAGGVIFMVHYMDPPAAVGGSHD